MTLRNILILLFLVSALSAFNVNTYLYPTEKQSDISFSEFTYNSMSYKLVKIKDEPIFMLKNDEILKDAAEIHDSFTYFAKSSYVPTDKELDSLRTLLSTFNKSRNDGQEYPGDEEYACRDIYLLNGGQIVIDGKVLRCTDPTSCIPVARGMFAIYQKILQVRTPDEIIPPLLEFTSASYETDTLVLQMFSDLNTAKDINQVHGSISDFKDNIPKIKALIPKITKNRFRIPVDAKENANECSDYRCLGLCGTFVFDTASLDQLSTKANDLFNRLAPLSSPSTIGSKILSNTNDRLLYAQNENTATLSTGRFSALNESGSNLITFTKQLLTRLNNDTIATDLSDFIKLHNQIPLLIDNRNLTDVTTRIGEYSLLLDSLNSTATDAQQRYSKVIDEKNKVQSLLFTIETTSLSPASQDSLSKLQQHSSDLELKLTTAVSEDELISIYSEYSQLSLDAENILKAESELPASRGVVVFRGFAQRVNLELSKEFISGASLTGDFLLFSVIVFVSFTSILLLIALTILLRSRRTIPKFQNALTIMSVCTIVVILGFSAFLYLLLTKTANEATLSEFKDDFAPKANAVVVIDLRNTSEADAQAMKNCANSLISSFKNKSTELYVMDYSSCNKIDNNVPSYSTYCNDPNKKKTTFYLRYSSNTHSPKFSVIYETKAEILANAAYYSSCPLPNLLG